MCAPEQDVIDGSRYQFMNARKPSSRMSSLSKNRSLSNKQPRPYQTKNFFDQTMNQMIQGKNNDLQRQFRRKTFYPQQVRMVPKPISQFYEPRDSAKDVYGPNEYSLDLSCQKYGRDASPSVERVNDTKFNK